jgi:GNAT superfamily N-acetyltransferase
MPPEYCGSEFFLLIQRTARRGKHLIKWRKLVKYRNEQWNVRSNCMEIIKVMDNKEKYMDLLLLGDEQDSMIKKYLHRGELFALFDDDLRTVSVVTQENEETYEIKNIATYEKYQGKGYGSIMVKYIIEKIKEKGKQLLVGTGESEKIIAFYKKFGFEYSHTIENFFADNYDHEMYENGNQLKDMIYLKIDFESV